MRALFDTQHHSGIGSIRTLDLAGQGQRYLVVESDWGGPGIMGASFYIFDIRDGALGPIFIARSQEIGDTGIASAKIDIAQTRLRSAQSICLVRTTCLTQIDGWRSQPSRGIVIQPDTASGTIARRKQWLRRAQ